ncbi:MAG: hypothetical protein KDA59_02085 [Planctomycetales bacterium]|nr:hypothetical protein [Planctomycetales bacterium]MCA9225210.1 hypothetical protein [Planctomycetales bacterium]
MNETHTISEDDPVFDELVAYLDHELDDAERLRIERRLAEDPQYREQLVQLQRSWDMLDELPRATASESFTQTTVEMVAVSTAEEVERRQASLGWQRTALVVGGTLAALLLAVVTYNLVAANLAAPNRELAANLPVIENLDEYRYLTGNDVRFLRMLDEANVLNRVEQGNDAPLTPVSISAKLLEEPQAVSEAAKQELSRKKTRFEELSPAEQQRLKELHGDLEAQPNQEHLRVVLAQYNDWMSALPSTQRADLLAMSLDKRLEETRQIVQRQEESRFRAYVQANLTEQDHQQIDRWLLQVAKRHEPLLLGMMSERFRPVLERFERDDSKRLRYLLMPAMQPGRLSEFLAAITDEEREMLVGSLSDKAQESMRKIKGKQKQDELLLEWVRASIWSKIRPSNEDMMQYLQEHASPADREYLENMPREKMQEKLTEMYFRYRRGPFGGRPPFGRGPDDRHGPDDRRPDDRRGADDRRGSEGRRGGFDRTFNGSSEKSASENENG